MPDSLILIVLFTLGVLILAAEVFLPSHGILTVIAVACLIGGIVQTFRFAGPTAGWISMLACSVVVPLFAFFAVKFFHRTPFGRLISPRNRVLTEADTSVPVAQIKALIGRTGRSLSPLRPVGVCEFGGRRISCVAQFGMIEAGAAVEGYGINNGTLAVVEKMV